MTQKTSPFLESKYGWGYGESGWNTGMDENLLKFSFLFDKNIDGIVDTLPIAVAGKAYYLSSEKRIYYAVGSSPTYYSTPLPMWFEFTLRSNGQVYRFDGTNPVQITSSTQVDQTLASLQSQVSSKEPSITAGTASQYWRGDKTFQPLNKAAIGLNNVDNTSDAVKPVSTAQQAALDLKPSFSQTNLTVVSLAALKGVDGAKTPWVYRAGYNSTGDDQGTFWRFVANSSLVADDVKVVAPNSGSGRWVLNHDGWVTPEQCGAVVGSDSFAAMQRAHASGLGVRYRPNTTYLCSGKISVVGPFILEGGGRNSTVIRFTTNTAGFAITLNNAYHWVSIRGVTLETVINTDSNQIAILIDASGQIAGSGGGHGITGDRTITRSLISDVECRGSDIMYAWAVGIKVAALPNFSMDNISIRGQYISSGVYSGVGIQIGGDGIPTDWSIRRLWTFYTVYGILLPDYCEGGHIYDFEMVHTLNGIYSGYLAGYSTIASNLCGNLGMNIADGHINCRLRGVALMGITNQASVKNLNIYTNGLSVDVGCVGVFLQNGSANSVSEVKVNHDASTNVQANNMGITLSAVRMSNISDNYMSSGGYLVRLVDACQSTQVHNNQSTSSAGVVVSDGAETNCTYMANIGVNISSNAYSVNETANRVYRSRYATAFSVTVTGGAVNETLTVALPVNVFTAKPSCGIASLSGNASVPPYSVMYDYTNAATTATSAKLRLYSPLGNNITAGTYRLNVIFEE